MALSVHLTTSLFLFFATGLAAFAANGKGDSPFQGNRRPGIVAEPTEHPTGENAKLYEGTDSVDPAELLDLLSEDPKISELSAKDLAGNGDDVNSSITPAISD